MILNPPSIHAALRLGLFVVGLGLTGCEKVEVKETYPEGSVKSEDFFRPWGPHDSLHRIRLKTFFFNGHPEMDAEYRQGLRHGSFRDYWHNGQIKSEGRYGHGKRQGSWKFYWNRFQLSSQGHFENDLKQGQWTEYFENGELRRRGEYHQGQEVGTWEGFNIQGEPIWISSCFVANDTGSFRGLLPNGEPEETYSCRQGLPFGAYEKRSHSGDVMQKGGYDSLGRKQGPWYQFYSSGAVLSQENFLNGLWQDSIHFYDSLGHEKKSGRFESGTGWLVTWDTLGHALEKMPYLAGAREGEALTFYPSGAKEAVLHYTSDTLLGLTRYHLNGTLAQSGKYRSGKRDSLWFRYYPNGKLAERSQYLAGILEGEQCFYDSLGQVTQKIRYEHGYPAEGKFKGVPGIRSISGKIKME